MTISLGKLCGIYAIENLRDQRVYVGATKVGFARRWSVHRSALIRGHSQVPQLQQDWDTYGAGWFKFVPLEILPKETIWGQREQAWIDRLRAEGYACYNVATGTTDRAKPWANSLRSLPTINTLKEVAAWGKVTVAMVRAMIRRGELQAIKMGRLWRVRREDLDDFMARQRIPDEDTLC